MLGNVGAECEVYHWSTSTVIGDADLQACMTAHGGDLHAAIAADLREGHALVSKVRIHIRAEVVHCEQERAIRAQCQPWQHSHVTF